MAQNATTHSERTALAEVARTRDEGAFRELVQGHMDVLLKAAAHELEYYVFEGYLREGDLSPEEVVGEALIHAWEHLHQRPEAVSLRGWLLGIQYRVLQRLVEQHRAYQDDNAISLDEPLPLDADSMDVQEWFWEWLQPDANVTWEDVVPGEEPLDIEIPLYDVRDTLSLDPEQRHVLMMHDEFDVPLAEVAFAMNRAVADTAELVDQARASLRKRVIGGAAPEGVDHPAPPDGSDT